MLQRPPYVSNMVRERVSVRGIIRPLEESSSIEALQMKPDEIGYFKEGTVKRYLEGKVSAQLDSV